MKSMNSKGFSFVKMMFMIAIIGILSTLAFPNYQSFQAKSNQSQVKAFLKGIYAAKQAFFVEWAQYYGDSRDIGSSSSGAMSYSVSKTDE